MKVGVVGMWHLGSVTAACLGSADYRVVGFDENAATVEGLRTGQLPVEEPGLGDLVRGGLSKGNLSFSADPKDLRDAEIVWIAYDTPVDDNDNADVEGVVAKIRGLLPHLADGVLVLISSQLPVGSTRRLEGVAKEVAPTKRISFACSPENLRLGKAIEVFTKPDRVIVGCRTTADREKIAALLAPFTNNIVWMSVESAEMTKHAINAFLAISVTFINEIASICEQVGANAHEVEAGLKSEARIGPKAYLRPGGAFAGGTLARDVAYLVAKADEVNRSVHLLESIRASNESHKGWACRRLESLYPELKGRTVAVLGLTYKPGTNTLRRSSSVEACRFLARQGMTVRAFDPAVKELPESLAGVINLCESVQQALQGADAAVVATEWPEFRAITADEFVTSIRTPIVLDANRWLEKNLGKDQRIRYLTVGSAS